jgi:hypothetical protein
MMDTDITDPSFKYAPSQNPIDPLNSSSATALPNTMAQQVDFVSSGSDFADNIRKQTRQLIDDQNNAMMLSMSKAAAGNAEEAAAAQRLGYETGVGAEIAARNKQLLEQRLATDRLAQLDLFRRDPVLARMLANKDFAAVAHDDLPNLMESGEQINPDLSWFEEFKIGRERGYKTTERGVTGADMLAASYSGVPIPESLRAKATQQSQEMVDLRASGGFLESFGALEGNIESTIPKQAEMALYGAVAGGLVLGAPTGGIGMVPGMVAGAGMGVMSAGVVQSFQLEGGNLFIDMLDDGIPEDTARVAAPIGGAIMAALEILPLKFVTGEAKKLIKREVAGQVIDTLKQTGMLDVTKRFLQSYGIGVTTEVGTELAQDAVSTYVQEMAMLATDPLYEEKWKSEKGRAELAKQFLETFKEVGQGMAIMGAFLPGANFISDARRARKAKATRQFFKDIDKNASESKLKGRNPRTYQEWYEMKARGTANHTLFIDIEKLREAMAKNNVSAQQLETILPGVTKAIADAKGMNGIDFSFPTSVYAARLSDLAFGQALQEHMRFDPKDMSIADEIQYSKEEKQLVEEMKESAMELMKADAAIDQSAQAVTDLVTAQLVAAGKYTESEARSMASVASASATVMSARFNMTPLDWHNKYGAKVFGEGQVTPAAPQRVAPALSVVASDKIKAKAAEFGISESQISEAETIASSIADNDWVGLAFADEETSAEGLARAQQDIAVREKYKDKASSIITGEVLPQDASAKVDARITTKSLEQALAEIEKVFEENRNSVGVRFVSIGLSNNRATVTLQVQLLSETQIREELANRAKAAKQAQAAPLEQASRIDADYMAAVERGDMETAQRMVDEAARAAGYTIGPVYHGTKQSFTSFRPDIRDPSKLSYFSFDKKFASKWPIGIGGLRTPSPEVLARIRDAQLASKELTTPEYDSLVAQYGNFTNIPEEKFAGVMAKGDELERSMLDGMTAAQASSEMGIKVIAGYLRAESVFNPRTNWKEFLPELLDLYKVESINLIDKTTKNAIFEGNYLVWESPSIVDAVFKKYNAIRLQESSASKQLATIAIRDPSRIKSSDPVTYDEEGNVIPLSRRFNIASTSILEQAAYRGEHTAPTNDGYAQSLNNLGGIFPNDIYSQDAARLYGTGNEQQDRQAISIIQSARGKPNQSIKIYRAVPLVLSNAEKIADIEKQKAEIQRRGYERWAKKQENPLTYDQLNAELDRLKSLPEETAVVKPQINNGDWVTISKQYAVEHGESALNGNYKIVTKTVPVKHLFTDGNSIQEWGYDSTAQGILEQAMPGGKPRATIDLSTFFITLNTAADLTSYLHEMAHFYMATYVNIANEPGAPPQITADLQIIFDWLGIKDLAAWNAMTHEEQKKYWEAFGYNHEIYLFEGKSPSVEMQGVFDRFSAWLRKIYGNIRDELNVIYRREFGEDLPVLTPEIRGVMDRILASEKQIKYAESVNNMTPLFLTQEQSGYDDARWAAYQAMVQEAHDQSVTDLTKASLRQMEWLSNARTRLLKEMQAKHDDIRDKMRSDIAEEVAAEPVYMAMSVLKTGKGRVANGEMVVFSDKYKLNLAIVKTMIPAENLSKLGYGKFGMLSEDGLHPDMVAEMFGFKSGDELVLALLAAKPVKEEVDSRLDARMLAEYGDMNTPAEMEVQVQKALHNEARERFIGVEARFVASATRPVRAMTDAARLAANTIVNAQKIENIRPSNYAAAEARAARDAADAYKQRQSPEQARKTSYTRSYNEQIAAGVDEATAVAEATKKGDQAAAAAKDRQDAFAAKYGNREPAQVVIRAKQAQVVQNQLVKVSTAALEEVDKALKDFRRFFKADEKIAKGRNMDLVDAARSILAFYGLGKHDKLPSAYMDKLQAYNPEMYKAVKPIIEMSQQAGAGGDHETLTVSEFRMMREVVDALWEHSRRDKQAEIAGKMVSVAQIQAEFIARTEEIGIPAEALGLKQALTENQKRIRHLMSTGAVLQRVENWCRRFDGPQEPGTVGPATKYIWRPIKNAVTAYKIDKNKYVKKFVELLNKVDLPVGKFRSDELDYTFGVGNGGNGKAELLGAMLHMGNESNLRKLLVGRGWGSLNADGTLDTSRWDAFVERMINEGKLTKEDFEFLQATWDLLEEIKPIAQKAHRDLYGYYFNEIEAKSFTNRFGTYRGGYVPAKTDAMIVRDAQRQAKMEELEADFRASMPSTGMGFTMGRVEYNEPLSIDLRLIEGHIDSVLRFSHIQPAVKDVLKIIGKGKFANNLTAINPFAIDGILLPWLNRTARQTTSVPGIHPVWDKSWNAIRKRTGIAIMMGGVRNAMQQFTGLFPAALLVKKGELKNAASTYFRNPMKTAAYVASLSPFMNDHMNSQIFVLQDNMNELLINPSKYARFKDWTDHHAYFLQTANQNIVNIVTWLGKYNQVLSEIDASISDSEAQYEAVQQADAAVRLTQGGMSPEDVARFQVGTAFDNSMTQFMGFFNMTANLNADEFVMLFRDLGWRGNKGKLMMIYILGIALPAMVSDAISRSLGQGWDDDDDGYLDDVADWFFGSQARYVTAFIPFGSAAYTALTTAFNDKPYDDRITSSPSITSLEASTVGVGKAIINIADDDKELTGRNVRDVLTLITNATGVPVSVLGRPIGYQVDVERGAVEPTNPIDYMRGLITGVPSAESKKK